MSSRFISGVYALRRRWQRGYLHPPAPDHNVFPRALTFQQLAIMMVNAQKVGFYDKNTDDTNGKRILREFNASRRAQPIIAVIVAVRNDQMLQPETQGDFGIMCLQRVDLSWQTSGVLKGKALMLTEVCRSRRALPSETGHSPIPCAMAKAESYALSIGFSRLYLSVEKHPMHGSGEKLLQIYGNGHISSRTGVLRRGYGYAVVGEDPEYWFLCKVIQ